MNKLAAAGLAAFVLGVGAMVAPWLVPFGPDRVLVTVVGLVAFVQAYRVVGARRRDGIRRAETPDPEVPSATPVPGEDLKEAIGDLVGARQYYRRDGLREAAVAVLTRYVGLSESGARARIADGTWTDDPFAAAHLGEDALTVPLRDRIVRIGRSARASRVSRSGGRESTYQYGRRRAIEEIAALAGIAAEDEGDGSRRWLRGSPATLGRSTSNDRGQANARGRDADEFRRRPTNHWRGVSAVALVAVGVGLAFDVASVVLSGVVGVGFAAYARASSPPNVDLSIEREVDADRPEAGEEVGVTLTVRNEGGGRLDDLRVVDGVPEALGVSEGSPRLGTTLGPGESATLTYAVSARRGVHAFEPVTVLARDVAGATEERRRIPVETTVTCVPVLRPTAGPVPLRAAATQFAGRVQTSSGGEGVEFYATRAYQPGDPTNRIDWNRRARTGELATLQFREERTATVVVAIDARAACYRSHEPHAPHAVDRSVEAAGRVVASLLDAGDRVGVAAFGADLWLAPGTGRAHRASARELLATDPDLSSVPPEGTVDVSWRRRLERRLPPSAQLVVLSPLCDRWAPRYVRTFDAAGHPTTVVSPDPTVVDGPGPLLSTVARRVRITDLRRAGVPVIDWSPDESIDVALARFTRRRTL